MRGSMKKNIRKIFFSLILLLIFANFVGATTWSAGSPLCGNNIIQPPVEDCDGIDLGGKDCNDFVVTGYTLKYYHSGVLGCYSLPVAMGCTFNTQNCNYCGDGIVNGDEECDDWNFSSDSQYLICVDCQLRNVYSDILPPDREAVDIMQTESGAIAILYPEDLDRTAMLMEQMWPTDTFADARRIIQIAEVYFTVDSGIAIVRFIPRARAIINGLFTIGRAIEYGSMKRLISLAIHETALQERLARETAEEGIEFAIKKGRVYRGLAGEVEVTARGAAKSYHTHPKLQLTPSGPMTKTETERLLGEIRAAIRRADPTLDPIFL